MINLYRLILKQSVSSWNLKISFETNILLNLKLFTGLNFLKGIHNMKSTEALSSKHLSSRDVSVIQF